MTEFSLDVPYAYGAPLIAADFRELPEDFEVNENLGFEPVGSGEHVYLQVTKRGENTDWIAQQIAKLANVRPMDVGLAGLKDRHAVTTQWFSVYLPKGAEPDWQLLNTDTVRLLTVARHTSKLRRGAHVANDFVITLRNLRLPNGDGSETDLQAAIALLNERLALIREQGVPNYFGEQRFGRGGNNLNLAQRWFVEGEQIRKRSLRGLVLSAARSHLFNQVLARRVTAGTWHDQLKGDVAGLPDAAGEEFPGPTGPLWGRGRSLVSEDTLSLENEVLAPFSGWLDSLEHQGLNQERRSLVLKPAGLKLDVADGVARLAFTLPPGTYATVVMRELFALTNVANVTVSVEKP